MIMRQKTAFRRDPDPISRLMIMNGGVHCAVVRGIRA